MLPFLALLLAHLLYDFHWQGPFIGEMKGKFWFILGVHALTYALCLWGVLYLFGMASWGKLIVLLVSHFAIDAWKARYTKLPLLGVALWIDQGLHVVVMVMCVL